MEIDAIIVDGKKYVPINGKNCDDCDFCNMACGYGSVAPCDLFHCDAFTEVEDEQLKDI